MSATGAQNSRWAPSRRPEPFSSNPQDERTGQPRPTRRPGPTHRSGPTPRPNRVDSCGHPGGSARQSYLEHLGNWATNPRPPAPPTRLRKGGPVRPIRGVCLRAWFRLCLKMSIDFAVVGAIVSLVTGWRLGRLSSETATFWPVVALAAGAAALPGIVSSIPISLLRHWRDPYWRELVWFKKEKKRQHEVENAAFRAAKRVYEENFRSLAPMHCPHPHFRPRPYAWCRRSFDGGLTRPTPKRRPRACWPASTRTFRFGMTCASA